MSKFSETRYHKKSQETPIVIYNALKLYATVRSETLIDKFFSLGLCISYKRVLGITQNISQTLINQVDKEKVILPTFSRKRTFTVIAKDNIGLNASSTTLSCSGTMIHHGSLASTYRDSAWMGDRQGRSFCA